MDNHRFRVILQARMSSTRLPGKVLLPVCGVPIVVLAAQRAARDGAETVVATSDDPSDDLVSETLGNHQIRHVRGSLDDVLKRFVIATADLDGNDICVRLTADNVFPDSDFVSRLVDALVTSGHGYVGFSGGVGGLPYGLAGEAVWVRLLREADKATALSYDREHVTPWVIRQYGRGEVAMPRLEHVDLSNLRCTIDTMDDYRRVSSALSGIANPIAAPWEALCRQLARWSSNHA